MFKSKSKYIKRFLTCLIILLVIMGSMAVSATTVPYDGYTYWTDTQSEGSRKSSYAKPAFEAEDVIDAQSLNVSRFKELTDFCVNGDRIYILDGEGSRITVLDGNYNLVKEFTDLNYNGEPINYTAAKGIFVKDGKLFVCDTENARVIIADEAGNVTRIIEKPDSPIIPEDFQYKPIKLTVDSQGYLYLLCEGSYYGTLLFDPSYKFIEFFGANEVTNSVATVMNNIISRVFPNNAKEAASVKTLPYSMSDLCMVNDDFIYTVTGSTKVTSPSGQIRKLFVGTGANNLKYTGNFVDDKTNSTTFTSGIQYHDLCSVDVDESGYIYALDSKYGKVFVYDKTGTMLSVFAGGLEAGEQEGTFKTPKTLALKGDRILVMDSTKCSITIFKPTEYFTLLKQAQTMTLDGDYKAAEEIWHKVLKEDSGCQLAYSGLARAEYVSGNYELAKEYAKKGYDRDTYSLAFKITRTELITKYLWVIALVAVLLIAALVVFFKIKKRKGMKIINNPKVKLAMSVLIHPIDTFTTIKEKRMSSIGISVVLLAIFYVTSIMSVLCGGFMFTYYDPAEFNSLWVLVKSAGVVVLWVVCNWLVCSLMSGNGRISEIITVVCYSLIPLIINQVIQIILTNIFLPDEVAFLNILNWVAYLLFFFMLASGSIIIHEYEFGKFIGTTVVTVFGMAVVVFLLFLIFLLFQQFIGLVSTIIMEISTF